MNKMNTEKKQFVFWTGGWDSTYCLIALSREERIIQPIYVHDPGRKSSPLEFDAMREITDLLVKKRETRAIICPTIAVERNDIEKNSEITDAYNRIKSIDNLGSQYEWLARLALKYPRIAIGADKPNGELGRTGNLVERNGGKLILSEGEWVVDKDASSEDCSLVLGGFSYPIIHTTELEMKKNVREWGYEDVMSRIWFCHKPIKGKACGFCRPCQIKMGSGMSFLLPASGRMRYRMYKMLVSVFGTDRAEYAMSRMYPKRQ